MEAFSIGEERTQVVWSILHDKVQIELLNCYDIHIQVSNEENRIIRKIKENGIQTQSNDQISTIDTIPKLDDSVKAFLHFAHASLREIKSLICYLFETYPKIKKVKNGNYENLKNWIKETFKEQDEFTQLIEDDFSCWLSELWKKRNTLPHPGGYSGNLHISNFTVVQDKVTKEWKGLVPTWHRNNNAPSSITNDMIVLINNILEFSEDVLVICLRKVKAMLPILIYEIKEENRDEDCPIRLQATLDQQKLIKSLKRRANLYC
ncbi:hypothetical protein KAI19_00995 [bacterium]|nr:hypothetical protein [bacterium]